LKERDQLEELGADGKIVLKCILKSECEVMNCTHLAQGGVQWRLFVNAVINIWVSWLAGELFVSQERLWSMELISAILDDPFNTTVHLELFIVVHKHAHICRAWKIMPSLLAKLKLYSPNQCH
jgi:hypothetical protein